MKNLPNLSKANFNKATQLIPGGASRNTILRSPHPHYVSHGTKCFVTDIDGQTRTDFANNMGSLIHGHCHPGITEMVIQQVSKGTAFTMPHVAELELAECLIERVPWFEQIRFMNSGTEAVMVAVKVARAFTGKPVIAKAEGTYHGTYDYAEISQNSTPETWGIETSPSGVPVSHSTPTGAVKDVVIFPFNELETTLEILNRRANEISCVLIDPLPHRAGLIPASNEFISGLRDWCSNNNSLLIFDEVISFRMTQQGAAAWYDDKPDLTTLGKIIGGGFPVGAVAGKEKIMDCLNPANDSSPVPWSGTFAANPVSMTAGTTAMKLFSDAAVADINELGDYAREEINKLISQLGVDACVTGAGSMFRIHPFKNTPRNYRTAWQDKSARSRTAETVNKLYENGFMLFRSCAAALSTVTSHKEIDEFLATLETIWK